MGAEQLYVNLSKKTGCCVSGLKTLLSYYIRLLSLLVKILQLTIYFAFYLSVFKNNFDFWDFLKSTPGLQSSFKTVITVTWTPGSKKVLSHRPEQVGFHSGQVTFHSHLASGQEIRQDVCQLNH